MKRLKLFIPLLILVVLLALLFPAIYKIWQGHDSKILPSVLVDKPFPQFGLPTLDEPEKIYSREDIVGKAFLLNVWATWCPSCKFEHPYLNKLAKEGIIIYGLDYRDDAEAAKRWLEHYGNPYALTFFDPNGELVLDLGVYGAPETFVVSAEGMILYRHVGVVNEEVWQNVLRPFYFLDQT